jgi:hypothetical protein
MKWRAAAELPDGEEACAISAQYIQRICPFSQGALYIINESRSFAEAVMKIWGCAGIKQEVFEPLSCMGHTARAAAPCRPPAPGLRCGHITGPCDRPIFVRAFAGKRPGHRHSSLKHAWPLPKKNSRT